MRKILRMPFALVGHAILWTALGGAILTMLCILFLDKCMLEAVGPVEGWEGAMR